MNKPTNQPPEDRAFPFYGYAPGNYMNDCVICKKEMNRVDKLCFVCLECAIKASKATPPSQPLGIEVEVEAKKYAGIKVPLRVKDYSAATKRVYEAFKAGYAASHQSSKELSELKSFLSEKAIELNIYVDFSDKSYDGDKAAPMDLFGFVEYLCKQSSTSEEEKDLTPKKFLETFEDFDFDEAFTDNELEYIINAMSGYFKYKISK